MLKAHGASFWERWHPLVFGAALLLIVLGAGYTLVSLEAQRKEVERRAEMLAHGALLRVRLVQELGNVLYLSSGLTSYVATRHRNLDRREVTEILSRLYAETRHVRNFGIAVGTRLTYVHPVEGNERAIGLDYRDVPAQWPAVRAIIESGKPFLVGPIDLVQGGRGLVYRLPIMIDGRYWGLLSTVVDADSFLGAAFAGSDSRPFAFALRGADGRGLSGGPIFGDPRLFGEPGTEVVEFDVPGGTWVLGLKARSIPGDKAFLLQIQALIWLLALLSGWSVFHFLRQRSRLEHMALHDTLTGLANRRLVEDRAQRALLRLRRDRNEQQGKVSAIVVFDLNDFKAVNDVHGHKMGDLVLRETAARVTQVLRAVDTVGRWGGDEFVVILQEVDRAHLPALIERLREAVEAPITDGGRTLRVGAAIGVAVAPDDGESVAELMRLADQRMYDRKKPR